MFLVLWINGSGEKTSSSEVGHQFLVLHCFVLLVYFRASCLHQRACCSLNIQLKAFRRPLAEHWKISELFKTRRTQPALCVAHYISAGTLCSLMVLPWSLSTSTVLAAPLLVPAMWNPHGPMWDSDLVAGSVTTHTELCRFSYQVHSSLWPQLSHFLFTSIPFLYRI